MVLEAVKKAIANHMGVDEAEVTPETTLEELKIDSLDVVQIVMDLEDSLGINLEKLENVRSVQDVVDYIQKKMEEGK